MALMPRRGTSVLTWEFVGKARAHEGTCAGLTVRARLALIARHSVAARAAHLWSPELQS